MTTRPLTLTEIISTTKMRGIVFPGSEIYEGLANAWDYGPVGVLMLNNVKNAWIKKFITECPYNVMIDSAILMNSRVWEASGHLSNFNDPLMDCKSCKSRFRATSLSKKIWRQKVFMNPPTAGAMKGWKPTSPKTTSNARNAKAPILRPSASLT
jgi:glycyl-tRNA synthetase (class II)